MKLQLWLPSAMMLLGCCLPARGFTQVVRLPTVVEEERGPEGRLVSHPDSSAEILQMPDSDGLPAPAAGKEQEGPKLPPGARPGVFQKLIFDAAWLPNLDEDGLGSTDLQLKAVFALPCPTTDSPLLITPGLAVHYLEPPLLLDLPDRLHEGYIQFRWLPQLSPCWMLDLAITPGVFSDFRQESGRAFRLPGHGVVVWQWWEKAKLALGVAYLDRPDLEIIPIGGLIWTPRNDLKYELLFPHPKIAWRIDRPGGGPLGLGWLKAPFAGENSPDDAAANTVQDWMYLAGEFMSDAWAIARTDGQNDQVVLSDCRLILGVERKVLGGLGAAVEFGYIFSRRVRYCSNTPDFYPSDTLMLRGRLCY